MGNTDIVLGIVLVGTFAYLIVAWPARRAAKNIGSYYLGGRNIGGTLLSNAYVGSSFSFANGIMYFSTLSFIFGPAVLWIQVPWVMSIWFMAWCLPVIILETEKRTFHGFLGNIFGPKARKISACTSIIGVIGIFAFEVMIGTEIVMAAFDISLSLINLTILSLIIGVFVALYCDIGGFGGTVKTDRWQNYLGYLACVIVFLTLIFNESGSLAGWKSSVTDIRTFFDVTSIPLTLWISVACFAAFFNVVEMSNWQTISANYNVVHTTEEGPRINVHALRTLRLAMVRSSVLIMFMPALAGSIIGSAGKALVKPDEPPEAVIGAIFDLFQGQYGDMTPWLLGVVVLGFVSIALSTMDSNLMSSAQAVSWDLIHHDTIDKMQSLEAVPADVHQTICSTGSRSIFLLSAIGILGLAALRATLGDTTAYVLQFTLAGIMVALAPATLTGLIVIKRLRKPVVMPVLFPASIIVGQIAGVIAFFLAERGEFDAFTYGPPAVLLSATVVVLPAVIGSFYKARYIGESNMSGS